jgi:hypothetical protein
VQVEEQVRVDLAEEAQQVPRLGRVGLHEVAVEVETLRVRALAGFGRTVLARAVRAARRFVPVDVVDRQEPQLDALQQILVLAVGELAQQRLQRFLALDFTRVDVADREDAEASCAGIRRRRVR